MDNVIVLALHTFLSYLDQRNTYVRLLLIGYSSAFNTIAPTKLVNKLRDLGLNTAVIMNFLTGRPQVMCPPPWLSALVPLWAACSALSWTPCSCRTVWPPQLQHHHQVCCQQDRQGSTGETVGDTGEYAGAWPWPWHFAHRQESMEDLSTTWCGKKANRIIRDPKNPGHKLFIRSCTTRLRNNFIQHAIRSMNHWALEISTLSTIHIPLHWLHLLNYLVTSCLQPVYIVILFIITYLYQDASQHTVFLLPVFLFLFFHKLFHPHSINLSSSIYV